MDYRGQYHENMRLFREKTMNCLDTLTFDWTLHGFNWYATGYPWLFHPKVKLLGNSFLCSMFTVEYKIVFMNLRVMLSG